MTDKISIGFEDLRCGDNFDNDYGTYIKTQPIECRGDPLNAVDLDDGEHMYFDDNYIVTIWR